MKILLFLLTLPLLAQVPAVNSGTATYPTSGAIPSSTTATALANGTTATTQSQNDNSTKLSTTAYTDLAVANAVSGVNPAVAVLAASTASLTGTYANGASGVGATFTVTATGAFTLDGVSIGTVGQRVLLKDQSSGFQNGIYTATVVGSIGVSPIFTRALDYNTPSNINSTGAIPVQSGTVNALTSWLLTSTVTTVGTDALTYSRFSVNPANEVLAVSPGAGICRFAGSTQTCTSSELSGDATTSGSNAVTVTKINGTSFAGTNGDVVSFGASNIPADSGFLATNVVRKDTTNTAAAAFTLNLTTNQGAQFLYSPIAPWVSATDAICAATAGTPACPSGAILVSGTNQASFATNVTMPANGLGTANRALHVVYAFDIGAAATVPTLTMRLLACPTANFTAGNATTCSSGGATLWTDNGGTRGTSTVTTPATLEFYIQGDGSNNLYTAQISTAGNLGLPTSSGTTTKVAFTTSSAWTLYITVVYSAATAGNWLLQGSVIPNYIN